MATPVTFEFGGAREVVTEAEANDGKQRLENLVDDDKVVVTKIDLSCKQWTKETIEIMRPAFEKAAPHVEILIIDDTIAGLETSLGLEIMRLWADVFAGARDTLRAIHISDNAMGPRAFEEMRSLLSAPNLVELQMNNCGLSAETIPALNEALKIDGKGQGVARLHSLILDRNMVGVEGAEQVGLLLPECNKMTNFSFRGCRPGPAGTNHITDGYKAMAENSSGAHKLTKLALQDCSFGSGEEDDDAMHALTVAIGLSPALTHVDLSDGGDFGEHGTGLLVQALINAKCELVELNLSGCSIGPAGAEVLRELLQNICGSLKVLKLESDELEDDGLASVVAGFTGKDNVLEVLRLDENELTETAMDTLIAGNFPKLRSLTLKDNMELEDLDEKKQELRAKFPNAVVCIDENDEEPATVAEGNDKEVDALADAMANLLK